MKIIHKTNKFNVVIVMLLCVVAFSSCFLDDYDSSMSYQFEIFKYNDGIDYSDKMTVHDSVTYFYNYRGAVLRVTPLADNYYASYQWHLVDDVYFTTLTIEEFVELNSLGLITQALIDSLPKDSNVYQEFYDTGGKLSARDYYVEWRGSTDKLDTAKLNMIIRNKELDKYFIKRK